MNRSVKLLRRFPSAVRGVVSVQVRRRGVPAARAQRRLLFVQEGGEKAMVRGGRRSLPRFPFFIGGRGNCAGYHAARIACFAGFLWPSCGHDSTRVYQTQDGHWIFCACACAGFEEATRIRLGAVFTQWIRARRRIMT